MNVESNTGSSDRRIAPDVLDPGGLRDVLGTLPSAVLVLDLEGRILFANHRAAQTLRRSVLELEGMPIERVIATMDALVGPRPEMVMDRSTTTTLPDGQPLEIGYVMQRLQTGAGSVFSLVFRDISRLAGLATERSDLARLALTGSFVPTTVHEVRNAIAAVTLGLEMAASEHPGVAAQHRPLLDELAAAAELLQVLAATTRGLRSSQKTSLDRAIHDARELTIRRAERRGIRLEWESTALPELYVDQTVLHAMLVHLASDAIRNNQAGTAVVTIVALGLDDELTVEVHEQRSGESGALRLQPGRPSIAWARTTLEEAGGRLDVEEKSSGCSVCAILPLPHISPSHHSV